MRAPLLATVLLAAAMGAAPGPTRAQVSLDQVADRGDYSVAVMSWRDLPFRNVVRQQYDFSCGSAAAATLLAENYGAPVDEVQAFTAMWKAGDQARIRRLGFSLLDIKRYLAARGYRSDGYRLKVEQLAARRLPAIALIQVGGYRHFVVFEGLRDGRVLVADPALGRRVMDLDVFRKAWNGIAFVIHDGPPPQHFDRDADWLVRPSAPIRASLPDQSAWDVLRDIPPIYEVSQVFNLGK